MCTLVGVYERCCSGNLLYSVYYVLQLQSTLCTTCCSCSLPYVLRAAVVVYHIYYMLQLQSTISTTCCSCSLPYLLHVAVVKCIPCYTWGKRRQHVLQYECAAGASKVQCCLPVCLSCPCLQQLPCDPLLLLPYKGAARLGTIYINGN